MAAGFGKLAGPHLPDLSGIGNAVARSTIGGFAAVLGGGKFENGAVTAAFAYLFNDAISGANETGRENGGAFKGILKRLLPIGRLLDLVDMLRETISYYYHYTPEEGRIGIMESGYIYRSGKDNLVFMTIVKYGSGAEAQAKLAMGRTPSGYFSVPKSNVSNESFGLVERKHGQPGGGIEVKIPHDVSIDGAFWTSIGP